MICCKLCKTLSKNIHCVIKSDQTIKGISSLACFKKKKKNLFTGAGFGAECQNPQDFPPAVASLKHQPLRPADTPVSFVKTPASRWQNRR